MDNELIKQWKENFLAENGRTPSMEEFQEAKARGFVSEPVETPVVNEAPQTLAEWKAAFVQTNGRAPSMEEFQEAKKALEANQLANEQAERVEPVVIPVQPEPVQVQQSVAPTPEPTPAPTPVAPQAQPVRSQEPKKPMSMAKKVLWTLGGIVLIAAGGAYAYADNYFSRESVAERSAAVLAEQKAGSYAEMLVWSDTKEALTEEEIAPMISWMDENDMTDKEKIASKLEGSGIKVAKLEENGKHFFLFPKYDVVVQPVNITVKSNQKDVALKVNGKAEGKITSDTKLKHRAPGMYQFEATAKVSGKNVPVKDSKEVLESTDIPLNIELISFDVESNMKTGTLYMGDTKIGQLKDGKYKVKNEPMTDNLEVYVSQKFKDSTVESEKRKLTSAQDKTTLTLDAEGMITESNASDVWRSAVSAINSYASDERIPSDLDMFNGGEENKAFDDFKKNIHHNLNNARRVADSITYSLEDIKSVTQTSETTATYVAEVETRFYYSSDTDKKEHSSGYKTQVFELTGGLVYDEDAKKWKLDSVSDNQKLLKDNDNVS